MKYFALRLWPGRPIALIHIKHDMGRVQKQRTENRKPVPTSFIEIRYTSPEKENDDERVESFIAFGF